MLNIMNVAFSVQFNETAECKLDALHHVMSENKIRPNYESLF